MTSHFDEFDNDDQEPSPLLPQDDRLWRHPSEISNSNYKRELQNTWLSREPSKASAWTAGIVGALLASGLVLLGTHLATALTSKTPSEPSEISATPILGATSSSQDTATEQATKLSLAPNISSAVNAVAESMVSIQANFGVKQSYTDGLVISQNGFIAAPATYVSGASSIIVTLDNQVSYVGKIVGVDNNQPYNSDIAVIRINAAGLHVAPLDEQEPTSDHQMVLALNIQAGKEQVLATTISALDTAQTSNWAQLIDSISISPTTQKLIPGTAILDDADGVVAFVVGNNQKYPVAIPAWLIKPVVSVIATHKLLSKGWLGIVASNYALGRGVLVNTVYQYSAASKYGILPGDVIISIDGQPTNTLNSLMARLYTKPPGSKVLIVVLRNDKILPIKLTLGSLLSTK